MNVNLYVIEDYENVPPSGPKKQSQFKPNPPAPIFTPKINIAPEKQPQKTLFPAASNKFLGIRANLPQAGIIYYHKLLSRSEACAECPSMPRVHLC